MLSPFLPWYRRRRLPVVVVFYSSFRSSSCGDQNAVAAATRLGVAVRVVARRHGRLVDRCPKLLPTKYV
jgi:hypothetical protein